MIQVTTTYPTSLLQDFIKFMDRLSTEEILLSPKNLYIPREWLWELNQLVSFKVVDATPRLDQGSYPLLHMFYHLALAGGLAIMIQGKGGKFALKVSERYEDYLDLTMTEQYFFLLETLWIDADWGALQKATHEQSIRVLGTATSLRISMFNDLLVRERAEKTSKYIPI